MKKLLIVLVMWCMASVVHAQTSSPQSRKDRRCWIDYATDGEMISSRVYKRSSKPDSGLVIERAPTITYTEMVTDGDTLTIAVTYSFKFKHTNKGKKHVDPSIRMTAVMQSDLDSASKGLCVTQFDTSATIFFRFVGRYVDPSKYRVFLKTEIYQKYYNRTHMWRLPEAFYASNE